MSNENEIQEIVAPVLFENQQWILTADGLESKQTVARGGGYFISIEGIGSPAERWIGDMLDKIWCDPHLFLDAYYAACELNGKRFERDTLAAVRNHRAEVMLHSHEVAVGWRKAQPISSTAQEIMETLNSFDGEEIMSLVTISSSHSDQVVYVLGPVPKKFVSQY